ncbi:flippase [Parabacteroides merdae]|jgi:O-antigen/teichoic acid export membrane protein|nr:flippase [Parabacteroides sp. AM18-12LB]RGZ77874.1 flippase [Parabacteroides merdae]
MGLKKNILYSGFLTTSLYIFQFITYPYVARVLGVTNIGICNFVQSIVQYFSLFAMLGISTLGVREIAKCNGDKEKLNSTFSQLFTLNFCFTFIVTLLYTGAVLFVPQFALYKKLLYIGTSQLLFGTFAIEWLFRGIEDFKYITVRTLFVRLAYVISIFLFVRDSNDYDTYFVIYSGMIIANGVINWNYRRRFVKFSVQSFNAIKKYIKPYFYLGTQLILTSLYTTFNTVYLGMICGDVQVGYYTTATKIENIILALYSSVTLVLMPRISSLMESGNEEGINHVIRFSFGLLFAFVFPCLVFTECFTEGVISLVAGSGYEGAVLPMKIVMPAMLIVGMEQILIVQILMPGRADKQVFINSVLGAICSIVLNLLIVPRLQSIGSSIVWIASEFAVMCSALYFVRKSYPVRIGLGKNVSVHFTWFLPLAIGLGLMKHLQISYWWSFAFGGITTLFYSHVILQKVIRNQSYIEIYKFTIQSIRQCIRR